MEFISITPERVKEIADLLEDLDIELGYEHSKHEYAAVYDHTPNPLEDAWGHTHLAVEALHKLLKS
jgi:transposase